MADAKITDLDELLIVDDADVLVIVDDSVAPKTTKKITVENAVKNHPDVAANTTHRSQTDNPHAVTKAQVGLGNADNTADIDKPVSTAQAAADVQAITDHKAEIDPHPQYETSAEAQAKVDAHANLTNNPHAVTKAQVGLAEVDDTSDADKPVSIATQAALDDKASSTDLTNHVNDTTNPHNVTKNQVGLGNVDNTSDVNKPVSTAQGAADAVVQGNLTTHINDNGNPHNVTKNQVGLGNVINESNQKGFLQYQNNNTQNADVGSGWTTLAFQVNRDSFPNSLFTKTSNTNFRVDFAGYVKFNLSLVVDTASNDRGFDARVLKNGTALPQATYLGLTADKSDNDRQAQLGASVFAECSNGDIFTIQLQAAEDSQVRILTGGAVFSIEVFRINP